MGQLEVSVSACSFCMDDTLYASYSACYTASNVRLGNRRGNRLGGMTNLGDSLPVKVRQEVDQVEISTK